jgi:hypothetical protein
MRRIPAALTGALVAAVLLITALLHPSLLHPVQAGPGHGLIR